MIVVVYLGMDTFGRAGTKFVLLRLLADKIKTENIRKH